MVLYDEKIKDRKKRVLRPWLYALDANPAGVNEQNPDSMPIYFALKRIAQPYLDKIQIEEKKAEEKKVADKNLSVALSKDKQVLETQGKKYKGIADLIFQSQVKRKYIYDAQQSLNKNNLLFTSDELLSDVSDRLVKSGTAMSLAYNTLTNKLYSENKAQNIREILLNSNQSKTKAIRKILMSLNYDYLIKVCAEYPDLQILANCLKGVYRKYLLVNIGFDNKNLSRVAYAKAVDSSVVSDDKDIQSIQKYYDNLSQFKTTNINVKEDITVNEPQVHQFLQVIDCILEMELYLAYLTFIRLMPLWVTNSKANNVCGNIYAKQVNNPKFLKYNMTLKVVLEQLLKSKSTFNCDWYSVLTYISCSEYKQGKVCSNINEYSEQITNLYTVSNYIVQNALG